MHITRLPDFDYVYATMKHWYILVLVLSAVFFSNCKQQPVKGCEKFKTGSFLYRGDSDKQLYKIERNESIQTETFIKTGDYGRLKINWTGPCEYELTFISQHIIATDSIKTPDQKVVVKTKIVRVLNDSCFTITNVVGDNNQMPGVLYIDKQ